MTATRVLPPRPLGKVERSATTYRAPMDYGKHHEPQGFRSDTRASAGRATASRSDYMDEAKYRSDQRPARKRKQPTRPVEYKDQQGRTLYIKGRKARPATAASSGGKVTDGGVNRSVTLAPPVGTLFDKGSTSITTVHGADSLD